MIYNCKVTSSSSITGNAHNHPRPCPMLENPGLLTEMVERSGAKSTDLEAPESAAHLCSKCEAYAAWHPCAKKRRQEAHRADTQQDK